MSYSFANKSMKKNKIKQYSLLLFNFVTIMWKQTFLEKFWRATVQINIDIAIAIYHLPYSSRCRIQMKQYKLRNQSKAKQTKILTLTSCTNSPMGIAKPTVHLSIRLKSRNFHSQYSLDSWYSIDIMHFQLFILNQWRQYAKLLNS